MATPAISAANFLAQCAGELPHNGGLKASSVKAMLSRLRSEFALRGIKLDDCQWAPVLTEVYKGLVARPDASLPQDEKWDVNLLLDFWRTQPSNDRLSLTMLRAKVCMLMMIAGLARPSDLERLDRRTLIATPQCVQVRAFRAKNSGAGYSEPIVLPVLTGRDK